jgi:lipoate-protein ligase B
MTPMLAIDLGLVPYRNYLDFGRALCHARAQGQIPDLLMFATHPPVITTAHHSEPREIRWTQEQIANADFTVEAVERGGHTTYHGPDQQMCYPVVRLELRELHSFVSDIHEALSMTAAMMGIDAHKREGFPGIWTNRGKLASIGLAMKRQVTLHGIALNCEPAASGGFEAIIPCGLPGVVMTDLQTETGQTIGRFGVRSALATAWEIAHVRRLDSASRFDLPDHLTELLTATLPETAHA